MATHNKGFNPSTILSFLAFENEPNVDASDDRNIQVHKHSIDTKTNSTVSSSTNDAVNEATLEPATLIYHESARSIVFRDHLRRVHDAQKSTAGVQMAKNPIAKNVGKPEIYAKSPSEISNPPDLKLSAQNTLRDKVGSKTSHSSELIPLPSDNKSKTNYPSQGGGSMSSRKDEMTDNNAIDDDLTETSRVTNDLSAYCGTSNHAVHIKSVSSITSSIEATQGRVDDSVDAKPQVIIANFTPKIEPLPSLDLEPHNEFEDLLLSSPYVWDEDKGPEQAFRKENVWNTMSKAEEEVVHMLLHQKCVVKTVKNVDWTAFIQKFKVPQGEPAKRWFHPAEFKNCTKEERHAKFREYSKDSNMSFNSFVTSTSLLPSYGLKMKCYGSTREYTTGMVFALPQSFTSDSSEEESAKRNSVWAWPSGYAAKTEFNISPYGQLINGREEALVPFKKLRTMNHSYLYDDDYGTL